MDSDLAVPLLLPQACISVPLYAVPIVFDPSDAGSVSAVWVSWKEACGALLGEDQQPWGRAGLAPLWFSFVPPAWLSSVSSAQAAAQREVSLRGEQVEQGVKLQSLFLETSSTFFNVHNITFKSFRCLV